MRKHHGFRDFLYNNNDILLAFIITVAAAMLIMWRLQIITDYPKSVAESAKALAEAQAQTEQPTITPGAETETPDETAATATNITASYDAEGKLEYDITVTLPTSSQEDALEMLFNSQLIVNEEEWKTIIEDEGLPSDTIIARQYTFTAGMTKVDIIKTVTGTDGTGGEE